MGRLRPARQRQADLEMTENRPKIGFASFRLLPDANPNLGWAADSAVAAYSPPD